MKKPKKIKIKTRKAAAKRFKITGKGTAKRNQVGKRHLLEHKSPSGKLQKRKSLEVADSDLVLVRRMMPGQVAYKQK